MHNRPHIIHTQDTAGHSVRPRPLIPRALRHGVALAIAGTALTAAIAAPAAWAAGPETFCVHQAGQSTCPTGATDEGSDLQSALNDAQSHVLPVGGAPNVIDIAPGTYTSTGFTYDSLNPLRLVGAGAGKTTLTGSGGWVLSLGYTFGVRPATLRTASVSGLTIAASQGSGLLLTGATADHVAITAQADGVELIQAALTSSTVSVSGADSAVLTKNYQADLDQDTIDAPGSWGIATYGPITIHRTTVAAQYGLRDRGGAAYIDDSLIMAQYGLYVEDVSRPASINALNDTVIGTQAASAGVVASAVITGADVQILNSIVRAFPVPFETLGGGVASIEGGENNYDGLPSGTGVHTAGSIGDDPQFVDASAGDYHLAADSPLIDASATPDVGSLSSTTDLDGNPRIVAVDHPGTPVDLGAYEYQPPATAANPGGGTPGGGTPGAGTPGTGNPGGGNGTPTPPSRGSRPAHPPTVRLIGLGHLAITGNRISLRLSCTGTAACAGIKVTATAPGAHHRRVTVGSVSTRLSARHKATLAVPLNRAGRALLTSGRRLRVTLVVTVRNGTRTQAVETAHVTLHRLP